MRSFLTIWRRELAACFLSPVAYVTLVIYLAMEGWIFLQSAIHNEGGHETLEVLLFISMLFFVPILATVICMRLFAEEQRLGTIETLMTAPVTETAVVMGKYAGALTFMWLILFPAVGYLFIVAWLGPGVASLDLGNVAGGCVMLALISASSVAIGLFVSLLTRNQIIAAICIFCAICAPFFLKHLALMLPVGADGLIETLAIEEQVLDYARGSMDIRPAVLHLSSAAFFLFTSVAVLQSRRWK